MLKIFKYDNAHILNEIDKFEIRHNIQLPEGYREFLIKYNGGNTPKTKFKINEVSTDIRAFYGLGNANKDYNFSFLIENNILENYLQKSYLPIAIDSFGNQIVIGTGKENHGEIHFFDTEKSQYEYLIKGFIEFIDKINSKNFVVRSIEERIQGMKEAGSDIEVDDDLIELWQKEINKYSISKQEKVII